MNPISLALFLIVILSSTVVTPTKTGTNPDIGKVLRKIDRQNVDQTTLVQFTPSFGNVDDLSNAPRTPDTINSQMESSSWQNPFDFSGTPMEEVDLSLFLRGPFVPSRINYLNGNSIHSFVPRFIPSGKILSDQVMTISTLEHARKIAQQRENDSLDTDLHPHDLKNERPHKGLKPLLPDEYELVSFIPGLATDGGPFSQEKNLAFSILGPDYQFFNVSPRDTEAIKQIRSRVVSLGHHGEITLRVIGDGYLENKVGLDFFIYENVFRIAGSSHLFFNEFAYVGVSQTNRSEDFKWFRCDPIGQDLKGCAGVVPTQRGAMGLISEALESTPPSI